MQLTSREIQTPATDTRVGEQAPQFADASSVFRYAFKQAVWGVMFVVRNVNDFLSINGHYLAAAIAFYGFMSIFPLSIALLWLSRRFIGIENFEQRLVDGILAQIPVLNASEGVSFVENFINEVVTTNNPALTGFAGLGLFVAGMGVFGSIRKSVNIIWGIARPRPFLIERVMDMALMLGASSLLFLSLLITAVLAFIEQLTGFFFPNAQPFNPAFVTLVGWVAPPLMTFIVFVIVYWWLPNTKTRVTEVTGIALLAAAAFEITKLLFIFYLNRAGSSLSSLYGSISTIMLFFFFVYVEAIVLLAGAMLSAKWSNFMRVRSQKKQIAALAESLVRIDRQRSLRFAPQQSDANQQS